MIGISLGLLVVASVGLLAPSPFTGRLSDACFDLLHFPVFILLTAIAMWIGVQCGIRTLRGLALVSLGIAFMGAVLEGLQGLSGRSPSLHDLFANTCGVTVAWVFVSPWLLPGPATAVLRKRSVRNFAIAGLVLLVAAVSYNPLQAVRDYWRLANEFPLIGSFEEPNELKRWWHRSTKLSLDGSLVTDGVRGAKLQVSPAMYPSFGHFHLPLNWSPYDQLSLDVRLTPDSPAEGVLMVIKIFDQDFINEYYDGYHYSTVLYPGQLKHIVIPLADVADGPKTRQLDLQKVAGLEIFFPERDVPVTVELDNIRLETIDSAN
ncbi:hypothetical protein FF011L_21060 [Roseimaritima multifibrata]|uniref:VanZ like family protein n=2 Tax=Roseimaritima multifibrata TaxID=1930274 RepID=A0A517MEN6_9BACT|nr:hypothetical protein FF011L_21060 [Roseimaritima multifibrata]